MNYQPILYDIFQELKNEPPTGTVATYIPELAKVPPEKFGAYLLPLEGRAAGVGDFEEQFSIQSIAKVLAMAMAFSAEGEKLWQRVGVEPSGNPFNSLSQLEHENGIPRNPLINAGALVVCDILLDLLDDPQRDFLAFVRLVSGCPEINYDPAMMASEKAHGFRNAALVNLMKSFGNIRNDTAAVLDFYFQICSLSMSCAELARAFRLFANYGTLPDSGEQILTRSQSKRLNAVMQLCGFYDEAGEFSFRVGLPGKSGVGGGIAAVLPGHFSVAVWSPRLNRKGNSALGMKLLEILTTRIGISVF